MGASPIPCKLAKGFIGVCLLAHISGVRLASAVQSILPVAKGPELMSRARCQLAGDIALAICC
jgi:hypothetical protein